MKPTVYAPLGVVSDSPIVARVRITRGDAALNATIVDPSAGAAQDGVVMDDQLYGESQSRP